MEKIELELTYEHQWIKSPLTIITKIDDRVINFDVTGENDVKIAKKIKLLDQGEHKLTVDVSGKTEDHTKIDQNSNITEDTIVKICSMKINQIELMPLIYHTDALQKFYINGQKDQVLQKLTDIGQNGVWEFKFKTPLYDWMLESLF